MMSLQIGLIETGSEPFAKPYVVIKNVRSAIMIKRILPLISASLLVFLPLTSCTSQADQIINTQTEVLIQDPTNVSALIERGNAFRDKDELTQALSDHSRAIELEPKSYRAYLARGQDYLDLKQYENALKDYNTALEINPESLAAYAKRGQTRVLLQENYAEALKDLNQAIVGGYREAEAYQYRAEAQYRLGDKDKALEDYLEASRLDPDNVDSVDSAIKLGFEDYRLYLQRGIAYKNKKSYSKAISDFTASIKMNAQNPDAFEERADAYYANGECTSAERDLRTACALQDRKLCEAISLGCSSASASPSSSPEESNPRYQPDLSVGN